MTCVPTQEPAAPPATTRISPTIRRRSGSEAGAIYEHRPRRGLSEAEWLAALCPDERRAVDAWLKEIAEPD